MAGFVTKRMRAPLMKKISALFFVLGLLVSQIVCGAPAFDATVDKSAIEAGEVLHLTVTLHEQTADKAPDFQGLEKDFSIIGMSTSQQVSVVNGYSTAFEQWKLSLLPKKVGNFVIPEFTLGSLTTLPLQVSVTQSKDNPAFDGSRDVFFTSTIYPEDPYIQSQAIYTSTLYYNRNIDNAQFIDPRGDNVTVLHLGKDTQSSKTINGKAYQVFERRYAVIPQKSGELTLDGGGLVGTVWKSQGVGTVSVAHTEPVRVSAQPVTLQVLPMPVGATQAWWLPADGLSVRESWDPTPPSWKAGQPVTRTITLEGIGLMAEQLPRITLPEIPNVQIYAEKPQLQTTTDGKTLLAKRVEKFVIIPGKSGALALPQIDIHWWNLKRGINEILSIPAYHATIGAGLETTQATTPAAPATPDRVTSNNEVSETMGTHSFWPLLTLAVLAGWLLTVVIFLVNRRRRQRLGKQVLNQKALTKRICRERLKKACETGDRLGAKEALIQWANSAWPQFTFRSLGDVEKHVSGVRAKAAIAKFDQLLYAGAEQAWDGQGFWKVVMVELSDKKKAKKKKETKDDDLPGLYPDGGVHQ